MAGRSGSVSKYGRIDGSVSPAEGKPRYLQWNDTSAFDTAAAAHFENLRKAKIRVGTQDLKIASIALASGATLLTRNTRDFARIPGLLFEDWSA